VATDRVRVAGSNRVVKRLRTDPITCLGGCNRQRTTLYDRAVTGRPADVQLHGGITELPAQEWAALEGGRSPLWSHGAFALMESAPIGADGFAYVAIRRGAQIAAVLPAFWLCGFALDDVVGSGLQPLARRVRRAWPGFARVSVLVCGHPLAEGRLLGDQLSGDESAGVLAELRSLADRLRLPWTLFKDFDRAPLVERLPAVGRRPFFATVWTSLATSSLSPSAQAESPSQRSQQAAARRGRSRRERMIGGLRVPQLVRAVRQLSHRSRLRTPPSAQRLVRPAVQGGPPGHRPRLPTAQPAADHLSGEARARRASGFARPPPRAPQRAALRSARSAACADTALRHRRGTPRYDEVMTESRKPDRPTARASGGRLYIFVPVSARPPSGKHHRAPGERAAALAASYCTRRLGRVYGQAVWQILADGARLGVIRHGRPEAWAAGAVIALVRANGLLGAEGALTAQEIADGLDVTLGALAVTERELARVLSLARYAHRLPAARARSG